MQVHRAQWPSLPLYAASSSPSSTPKPGPQTQTRSLYKPRHLSGSGIVITYQHTYAAITPTKTQYATSVLRAKPWTLFRIFDVSCKKLLNLIIKFNVLKVPLLYCGNILAPLLSPPTVRLRTYGCLCGCLVVVATQQDNKKGRSTLKLLGHFWLLNYLGHLGPRKL